MNIIRNVVAVIVGLLLGSAVNMGLILLGNVVVPLPGGIDPMDPESLAGSMHLLETRHFVFPLFAHALGTLAGAFAAAAVAASYKQVFALVIGCGFLLGGIINAFMLPAPLWFIAVDLIVAYLPMAWLGGRLAHRIIPARRAQT